MGNSCLKGGQDYAVVNRKRGKGESGQDFEDSGGPGGSYRKTANAAKYQVPKSQSNTDLNKNKPQQIVVDNHGDDEALNLHLQTPVATDEEVGVFFEEQPNDETSQRPVTSPGSSLATNSPGVKPVDHSPKSNGGVVHSEEPKISPPKPATTHVEVFNLSIPADPESPPKHDESIAQASPAPEPEVVHINLTDYVTEQQSPPTTSPSRSSTKSGTVNPIMTTDLDATTDSQVEIPVIDLAKEEHNHSETHVSDTSATGVTNEAFDISDEQEEASPEEIAVQESTVMVSHEIRHDLSDVEIPDDKHFFFGMESLKFQSKTPSDYDGEEADREVAEIMSDLDTIEDGIWITLKPPVDETDSVNMRADPDGGSPVSRKEDPDVYASVLSGLKDVCNKVEDILRKKGIDSSYEYDDSWLSVPDFSSLNERYDKATASVQTETVKRLIGAADENNENKAREILEEYKRQQERLLRIREAQKTKLMERMKSKISSRKSREFVDEPVAVNEVDGESDNEKIQDGYGAILSTNSVDNDSLISDNQSISEEESDDTYSSSDDVAVLTEADVEANHTLKQTLKDDIGSRITDMTSDDFQSIMGMYRKERQGIRDIRDAERGKLTTSLWDKLADRRRVVDGCSFEESQNQSEADNSEEHSVTEDAVIDSTTECSAQVSSTQDSASSPDSRHVHDVATETDADMDVLEKCVGVTQEDLTQLNRDLMGRTLENSASNVISQSEADQILRDHFNCVKNLREQRDSEAARHRKKVMERLQEKKESAADEISIIESGFCDTGIILQKEEDSLEESCLERVRHGETITQDELKAVLDQYTTSQHSLIEQRIRQRAALNQRLRAKLAIANENRMKRPPQRQHGEEEIQTENQIKSMDDAFYQSLVDKRQGGELTSAQLAQLIDEHLDLVDEFKTEVRTQMNDRRKERRRQADSDKITALVQQDKENRENVRRLRQQEKNRMDDKLQEKLKHRKQNPRDDKPELTPRVPPKKPERKRKSRSTDSEQQSNRSSYENVQLNI